LVGAEDLPFTRKSVGITAVAPSTTASTSTSSARLRLLYGFDPIDSGTHEASGIAKILRAAADCAERTKRSRAESLPKDEMEVVYR
jgi:hypothetical protein